MVRPQRPGIGEGRPGGVVRPSKNSNIPSRPKIKQTTPRPGPGIGSDGGRPSSGNRGGYSGQGFDRPSTRRGDHGGDHGGRHWNNYYGSPHHPHWTHADRHGIHYGGHPYHHHYDHGYHHRHSGFSFGLWISFRGVPWYYCPTYRSDTYVYVSHVYESHYYFGAGTGARADRAVATIDAGWQELERGQYDRARRSFAQASADAPDWGLPKIGYALALAGAGHDAAAAPVMRLAMAEDPYAALEAPWSDELGYLLDALDVRYTDLALDGVEPHETWFMAASLRLMLGDADGASEAVFNAEAAGAGAEPISGLLEVLTATEAAPSDGLAE